MLHKTKNLIVVLLVLMMAGCSTTNISRAPQQDVTMAGEHLNKAADETLPGPAYKECSVGEWQMRASTDSAKGNSYIGHSSQACAPAVSRGENGYTPLAKE